MQHINKLLMYFMFRGKQIEIKQTLLVIRGDTTVL